MCRYLYIPTELNFRHVFTIFENYTNTKPNHILCSSKLVNYPLAFKTMHKKAPIDVPANACLPN